MTSCPFCPHSVIKVLHERLNLRQFWNCKLKKIRWLTNQCAWFSTRLVVVFAKHLLIIIKCLLFLGSLKVWLCRRKYKLQGFRCCKTILNKWTQNQRLILSKWRLGTITRYFWALAVKFSVSEVGWEANWVLVILKEYCTKVCPNRSTLSKQNLNKLPRSLGSKRMLSTQRLLMMKITNFSLGDLLVT